MEPLVAGAPLTGSSVAIAGCCMYVQMVSGEEGKCSLGFWDFGGIELGRDCDTFLKEGEWREVYGGCAGLKESEVVKRTFS